MKPLASKHEVTYSKIAGQFIRARRILFRIDLETMAQGIGVSRSGWSRVETGVTMMTIVQLRKAASLLRTTPGAILRTVDSMALDLESSGVVVVDDRAPVALRYGVKSTVASHASMGRSAKKNRSSAKNSSSSPRS